MKEENVLERIRQLTAERSWTLYRLAKESGISYSTLSNSFHRNNVPTVSTLIQICDGLGITLSEFFDESSTYASQLTDSDQQLLDLWHTLSRTDRALTLSFIHGLKHSPKLDLSILDAEREDDGIG